MLTAKYDVKGYMRMEGQNMLYYYYMIIGSKAKQFIIYIKLTVNDSKADIVSRQDKKKCEKYYGSRFFCWVAQHIFWCCLCIMSSFTSSLRPLSEPCVYLCRIPPPSPFCTFQRQHETLICIIQNVLCVYTRVCICVWVCECVLKWALTYSLHFPNLIIPAGLGTGLTQWAG